MADNSLLARHYIDYVYVPGALLIAGTAIVKSAWLVYAIPIALLFGAYNFWNFRELTCEIIRWGRDEGTRGSCADARPCAPLCRLQT